MPEGNTGLVKGLIIGIGGLAILTIVVFVVVSTILDAGLLRTGVAPVSAKVNFVSLNDTGFQIVGWNVAPNYSYSIVLVTNLTGVTVDSSQYRINASGVIKNATETVWDNPTNATNITYQYYVPTEYERSTSSLGGNLTRGVANVSGKLPTILLIAVVVLLFAVIVLLVRRSQDMGIGNVSGGKGTRQREGSL